ncbi:hypothetical protein B0J12DRAFT_773752 [Macrophomina phaseolina]|uniref:Uncharacterized protein n=1 Tax=Macrophomina phaseolina TaxID=35725 RepID=A0ABQ8FSJ2_9PEZI|nr:hypothetical protein B0J12DRAFT_773752 [Macrophomina phaseolina]
MAEPDRITLALDTLLSAPREELRPYSAQVTCVIGRLARIFSTVEDGGTATLAPFMAPLNSSTSFADFNNIGCQQRSFLPVPAGEVGHRPTVTPSGSHSPLNVGCLALVEDNGWADIAPGSINYCFPGNNELALFEQNTWSDLAPASSEYGFSASNSLALFEDNDWSDLADISPNLHVPSKEDGSALLERSTWSGLTLRSSSTKSDDAYKPSQTAAQVLLERQCIPLSKTACAAKTSDSSNEAQRSQPLSDDQSSSKYSPQQPNNTYKKNISTVEDTFLQHVRENKEAFEQYLNLQVHEAVQENSAWDNEDARLLDIAFQEGSKEARFEIGFRKILAYRSLAQEYLSNSLPTTSGRRKPSQRVFCANRQFRNLSTAVQALKFGTNLVGVEDQKFPSVSILFIVMFWGSKRVQSSLLRLTELIEKSEKGLWDLLVDKVNWFEECQRLYTSKLKACNPLIELGNLFRIRDIPGKKQYEASCPHD